MSPELAAQLAAPGPETDVEIWPDMQPSVAIFFAMRTQWRWCGAGLAGAFRTGLDLSALPAIAGIVGKEVTAEVLNDLSVMEAAALKEWNRK